MENWDDLRLFLAVAEHGSTNAAAAVLGLNATTLGRRVKALEAKLDLALFDRDTKGYHLTPEGQELVADAQVVADAYTAFCQHAERLQRLDAGTIRITAPETVFDEILAGIVSDFAMQHPGLRFTHMAGNQVLDLASGDADIAFRGVETPSDERLIGRRLRGHKWTVYAGNGFGNPPRTPEDLFEHPVAIYRGPLETLCPHQWFLDRIDPGKIVAECNTQANMRAVIRSGAALGLLSASHADHVSGITRCFPPPEENTTNFWLLASPTAYRRTSVRRFIQFAARRFNEELDRLQGSD